MKTVLITGARGFLGKNLCAALEQNSDIEVLKYGRENTDVELQTYIRKASFVFHLAGANRPKDESEFETDNTNLTKKIVSLLQEKKTHTALLLCSSTQASLNNPYGISKRSAENIVSKWSKDTKSLAYIFRLPNIFGKWARPNYNSVVATFCYNLVQDIPLQIDEPGRLLNLVHVDDVVRSFIDCLEGRHQSKEQFRTLDSINQITVGELAEMLKGYWESRQTQVLPNLSGNFNKALYSTLISYSNVGDLSVKPTRLIDERGWLFELVKSKYAGQIFVSNTKPGYTRGDHWHHTKVEKFTVIKGSGKLLFRHLSSDEIVSYSLSDEQIEIVDIPSGYIHAIHNDSDEDMLLLIWASEIFDKDNPDTYYEKVRF